MRFVCWVCGEEFDDEGLFAEHLEAVHGISHHLEVAREESSGLSVGDEVLIQLARLLRLAVMHGHDSTEFRELVESVVGEAVEDIMVDAEGCRIATASRDIVVYRDLAPDGKWSVEVVER